MSQTLDSPMDQEMQEEPPAPAPTPAMKTFVDKIKNTDLPKFKMTLETLFLQMKKSTNKGDQLAVKALMDTIKSELFPTDFTKTLGFVFTAGKRSRTRRRKYKKRT